MLNKMFLLSVCLPVVLSAPADQIIEERANYRIILPDNPSPVVKFAGDELQYYLEKIYNGPAKLDKETPARIDFLVGFPAAGVWAGFTGLPGLDRFPGGFGVFRRGHSILMHGLDDAVEPLSTRGRTGTLLSVYYFLQKYAGVVFFAPGEHGVVIPRDTVITVKEGDDLPEPSFEVRGFSLNTKEFPAAGMAKFFKQRLCNIPDWAAYQYYYMFLNKWPKRFRDSKPELFAIRNGKRFTGSYPNHFPCLSNPEVFSIVCSDLIEVINKDPKITNIRVFSDAPYNRCECEECRKAPVAEYIKNNDNSEEIYSYLDRIAAVIHQTRPDMVFMTQTKGHSYSHPPQTRKMSPNIVVEILTNRPAVGDYSGYAELCEEWRKAGVRTLLKSYPRYPAWKQYPIMNPLFTVNYFKSFQGKTHGSKYSDLTAGAPYSFAALNCYVQSRILFDAGLDGKELIAEFCAAAYPGAEKEMCRFYEIMEALLGANQLWADPMLTAYQYDKLREPAGLLAQAAAKATDSYWLDALVRDFTAFMGEAEKRKNEMAAHQEEINKIRAVQDQYRTLKVPAAPASVTAVLSPSKIYGDYQESEVSMSGSHGSLVLKFTAHEKLPAEIAADCSEDHQGSMWADDSFEIMLAPPETQYPYYQIIVNSNGKYRVLYREKPGRMSERTELTLKASGGVGGSGWHAAIEIPLDKVSDAVREGRGRIGIFRNRLPNDKTDMQRSGVRISSASFHEYGEYSKLELEQ